MTARTNETNARRESTSPDNTDKDTFNHVFEGWSVWLEPSACATSSSTEPNVEKELFNEMEFLLNACGGQDKGVHPFIPHCTLLYNVSIPNQFNSKEEEQDYGKRKIQKCLEDFRLATLTESDCENSTCTSDSANSHSQGFVSSKQQLFFEPSDFYYFEYPKHADNGRGFGCVISMLLLKNTPNLALLQNIAKNEFPPDERHVGGNKFIPHMALVYAPEAKGRWLQKYTSELPRKRKELLRPCPVEALSLWSTKGKVCDWYRIAKIEL